MTHLNIDEARDEEETARRRDEALRHALTTPPQPKPTQNPKVGKPAAPSSAGKPSPTGEAS